MLPTHSYHANKDGLSLAACAMLSLGNGQWPMAGARAMHPSRLSFLSYRHAVLRRVVRWEGDVCHLACGHMGHGVSHFDHKLTREWKCAACGVEWVKASPLYAAEFQEQGQ